MTLSLDRLWLWGMKVNALQAVNFSPTIAGYPSTLTTEQAIQRFGIPNVLVAGGLPISEETLRQVPSAKRIICKWSLHGHDANQKPVLNLDACMERLRTSQQLAQVDPRIEAFVVDDFSTGTLDAGLDEPALRNFVQSRGDPQKGRQIPLMATVYSMSLNRPELPPMLPHFDSFLMPLWHADQIDDLPPAVDRLSAMTGGKPITVCLYVYDFGNDRLLSGKLMQRHLDVAEGLLSSGRATGLVLVGTCLMDLPWEANDVMAGWLKRVSAPREAKKQIAR